METHWLSPCCAAAVRTVVPDGSLTNPLLDIAACALEFPRPRPVDGVLRREEFHCMRDRTAITTQATAALRLVRWFCAASFPNGGGGLLLRMGVLGMPRDASFVGLSEL